LDRGAAPERRGLAGAVDKAATVWALAGGVLLLAIVAINAWSILANAILGRPFAGAFELSEVGVGVAVFSFLPFCQISGANVTADIFTARASPRWISAFALLAAVVALGFALLLAQRMWLGLIDQKAYNLTTAILQMPIWWAFVPVVVSLVLLALAALVSLVEAARDLGRT
jgi:TRAP-type C4-dicarboxylate transport system permease small subunit